MQIRPALDRDLGRIMNIYRAARGFMIKSGNPTQWWEGYPPRELIQQDIISGIAHVCTVDDVPVGVFAFILGEDPTYRVIESGAWHHDLPYGTIHRIASSGQYGGVTDACFSYCRGVRDYLRIDTHEDNRPMQAALARAGFEYCGVIRIANGSPRIAFDRLYP